jgi:5'-3' exoribonuclease 1
MGIPRFFRFVSEEFPNVYQQISFNQGFATKGAPEIDNLYLDANGILHNCAQEVYFSEPRLAWGGRKCPEPLTPKQQESKHLQAIANYMDQLLKFVKPKQLFYIAIDGPAPMAKQTQQRQRRYKAAVEKDPQMLAKFDTTAITPGTVFMNTLGTFLKNYIRKKQRTDRCWSAIKVIFSGADEPGEGEHKIVHYIRTQAVSKQLVHCMYGLDADLFMLSLATHCPKFYLLREDQFKTCWSDELFYKVDIGQLRKEIHRQWGSLGSVESSIIDDFVFICFLVGNDFLHALPCCKDLAESISYMMNLRKRVLQSNYLTAGKSYNLNNLLVLLKELSGTEVAALSTQYYQQFFPNVTIASSLLNRERPELGISLSAFRVRYYKKAGVNAADQQEVWNFCKHYLQGLEWVQYYYHQCPRNWHWYYPYHYTPLATDLVDYLRNGKSRMSRVSNKDLPPITAHQQLLCVVPPQSRSLLPKNLQPLYNSPILKKFYPTKFEIDLEGKVKEWEGIALLPFVDLQLIIQEYQKVAG